MLKKYAFILAVICCNISQAQLSSTAPEYEAHPVGGKEQLDWVFQTQLTLSKLILNPDFELNVTVFFNVDSTGNAVDLKTDNIQNNVLRKEVYRQFRFLKFKRTLNLPDETRPYFSSFRISSDKYNKYYKQKSKLSFKKTIEADSSYSVYSRADKSPDYYRNGDDGLKEFILSEMEYPKIAVERSVEGTVILEFIVETNGYITNVVSKQNVNAGCTEEALRIIKQTKWQPAILNNKLVRYKMTYPITFSIRNAMRAGSTSGTTGQ